MAIGNRYQGTVIRRYKNLYLERDQLLAFSKILNWCAFLATLFSLSFPIWLKIGVDPPHRWSAWGLLLSIDALVSLTAFGCFKFASVLVRAQANILTTCIDGILNDSPFLTDDERLEAMDMDGDSLLNLSGRRPR